MSKPAMWKTPPRREYKPKVMDPGQVIVWTVVIPAKWDTEPSYDPETDVYTDGTGWTPPATYERIGTIWSAGHRPNTWWVLPDGDMLNPVLVLSTRPRGEGELYQDSAGDGWRDRIRRAENVRRRGVYAVAITSPTLIGRGPYAAYSSVWWHSDPDCPEAAGMERREDNRQWTLHRIVDVLVGRERYSGEPPLCKHCIMLEPQPEPARELVTA